VGSIAQWNAGGGGDGHVAYVESVNYNSLGKVTGITVTEDNFMPEPGYGNLNGGYTAEIHITAGSSVWPANFIHAKDQNPGTKGPGSQDLLRSGSFEGSAAGWGRTVPSGVSVGMVDYNTANGAPAPAHDGQWYLAFNTNGSGGSVYQDVTVNATAGTSYVGTAWLSSQSGTATGQLCLWGLGSTNTHTCIPYSVQAGTYTPVQVTYVAPGTISKVRFQVYPTPNGGTTDMDTASIG